MENPDKKAVIYCRTATIDQAESLGMITRQENKCYRYAEEHGYQVMQVYQENGKSGLAVNRGLRHLLATLLTAPEPITVITQDAMRMSRNAGNFEAIRRIISALGCEIICIAEQVDVARAA